MTFSAKIANLSSKLNLFDSLIFKMDNWLKIDY